MNKKVRVVSILNLVDKKLLERLAAETSVDFNVKKLSGNIVFKLLLLSILEDTKVSLRVMEKLFVSNKFKCIAAIEATESIRYNSLSERLSVIKISFFEKIFASLIDKAKTQLGSDIDRQTVRQFDSTSISLSGKLLQKGMTNGLKNKQGEHKHKQIKFTVGLYSNLPASISFYNEQKHLAEDEVLKQEILKTCIGNNEVVVFDRGIKSRQTFKEFNEQSIDFVTRINPTKNLKIIQQNPLPAIVESETLTIISDEIVHLFYAKKMQLKTPFRLIKAISKSSGETLYFLTNITHLLAVEITEIYKQRWDIEVFFKFIKQHLHFKHFFSYNENGIKVMMYMTMIAAVLLLLYKKLNNLVGYKFVKIDFVEELDREIIKEIILMCGGDPTKHPLFNKT